MADTFGPEYQKINTAFKRDGKGVIIPGEWSLPEFHYLAGCPWRWTEKVDGTNIRLHWNGERVIVGGRTDNAQVPASLVSNLQPFLDPSLWRNAFGASGGVTVYGEGYGAKIQKGAQYRPDQAFIVFDIGIGPWWLTDEDVHAGAELIGFDVVPSFQTMSLIEACSLVADGDLKSKWPGATIEGLVGKPAVDLHTRRGERIITKLKVKDWADYRRRSNG